MYLNKKPSDNNILSHVGSEEAWEMLALDLKLDIRDWIFDSHLRTKVIIKNKRPSNSNNFHIKFVLGPFESSKRSEGLSQSNGFSMIFCEEKMCLNKGNLIE